ncbi:MAG: ZIP family metal transporter [Candidatus Anstonellaceae archaeon]
MDNFQNILLGAGLAFFATAAGALSAVLIHKLGRGMHFAIIAFAAGVMGFSSYEMMFESSESGIFVALGGFLLGMIAMLAAEKLVPHEATYITHKKAILIAGAITLHNIPEGLAIGSSFASSEPLGWLVAASIALQDFPEGLIVSAPLIALGLGKARSLFWGAFSGAVEAAAAIAGFALLSVATQLIPLSLAFAAGAMVYIIAFEMRPFFAQKKSGWLAFVAGVAFAYLFAGLFIN